MILSNEGITIKLVCLDFISNTHRFKHTTFIILDQSFNIIRAGVITRFNLIQHCSFQTWYSRINLISFYIFYNAQFLISLPSKL